MVDPQKLKIGQELWYTDWYGEDYYSMRPNMVRVKFAGICSYCPDGLCKVTFIDETVPEIYGDEKFEFVEEQAVDHLFYTKAEAAKKCLESYQIALENYQEKVFEMTRIMEGEENE